MPGPADKSMTLDGAGEPEGAGAMVLDEVPVCNGWLNGFKKI